MARKSPDHTSARGASEADGFLDPSTTWQQQKTKGWRFGVLMCACSGFLVFGVNLIATIWAVTEHGVGRTGRQTLYRGNCATAAKLNTGIHLMINVLSTVLLSSSNYCMQCLSAPTREEVDRAHLSRKWLDIGVLSIRNLRSIAKKRVVLWWLLGASSLPLHLFYNSAVFSSITTTYYTPIMVSKAFVEGKIAPMNVTVDLPTEKEALRLRELNSKGKLERLDTLACINAYAREFQTRGSVLLVTTNVTEPAIMFGDETTADSWVCSPDFFVPCEVYPRLTALRSNPSTWTPFGDDSVDYCLSEKIPENCTVQSSLHLAVIVIVLNLVKALIMLSLFIWVKEMPLMTIGDAISSYLERADRLTESMCLASKEDFKNTKDGWVMSPRRFTSKPQRLYVVASKARWMIFLTMYVGVIALVAYLLALAITSVFDGLSNPQVIQQLGLGRISVSALIDLYGIPSAGASGLIANVLVANAGQVVLSVLYFSYNGLFTAFCTALEWESYARTRKGLRVSGTACGEQRSTYFLQLPYRIAIPLMTISGLLHWLVSQSIFIVSIREYSLNSKTERWTYLRQVLDCGFSPLAIILVLAVGIFLVLILIIVGSLRFKTGTPVAASCSVAIAAACHNSAEEEERNSYLSKVQWGVTGYDINGIGHCSFSKRPVTTPEDGRLY